MSEPKAKMTGKNGTHLRPVVVIFLPDKTLVLRWFKKIKRLTFWGYNLSDKSSPFWSGLTGGCFR